MVILLQERVRRVRQDDVLVRQVHPRHRGIEQFRLRDRHRPVGRAVQGQRRWEVGRELMHRGGGAVQVGTRTNATPAVALADYEFRGLAIRVAD